MRLELGLREPQREKAIHAGKESGGVAAPSAEPRADRNALRERCADSERPLPFRPVRDEIPRSLDEVLYNPLRNMPCESATLGWPNGG